MMVAEMVEQLTVEGLPTRPWYNLTLPPAIKTEFDAWSAVSRQNENLAYLALTLGLTISFLWLDVRAGHLDLGLTLRLGLQAPALMVGIWLLKHKPHSSIAAWFVMGPVWVLIGTMMILALDATPDDRANYLTGIGVTIAAATLCYRLDFRYAVMLCACNIGLYAGSMFFFLSHVQFGQSSELIASMSVITCAALIPAARRERSDQDLYLLNRRVAMQSFELNRLVSELSRQSNVDALTGIGNRRCFDHAFRELWDKAVRDRTRLGFALIDIDHFKSLNDLAGHAEGDRCLRAVAKAIEQNLRPDGSVLARFGGEEFAVLLPLPADTVAAAALGAAVGERVRACVENLGLGHPDPTYSTVTVSVGVAVVLPGQDEATPSTLLDAADQAMYRAKSAGRNRMMLATDGLLSAAA